MIILSIRTDNPMAEVGLFRDGKKLGYKKWQADRRLTVTVHEKIYEILNKSSITLDAVEGIIIYKGPGSFTGLRIGFAVANALAYANAASIVAIAGNDWLENGLRKLGSGESDKIALPDYGHPPHITKAKK